MRLEYKPQFFDDLDDIKEYITQNFDSELAREKVRQIYDSCAVLLENPKKGSIYKRDDNFQYIFVLKKDFVFYHVDGEIVTIHRVFDGRRDYASLL